jgi:hypothetical protein
LSDFGIVRLLDSARMTSAEFTLGTASYLAPEQARGADVGPVADVYSLGLVLIEASTGVRSYDGPPLEAVMARLSHGPGIPEHLPPPWPSLLAAMTALDPAGRPNATQVAETLRGRQSAAIAAPILMDPSGADETPTVGLAALGAAGAAGIPAAVATTSTEDPWNAAADPPKRRHTGWLLAAAAIVAALAVTALLMLRPTSHSRSPADSGPGPSTHHPAGSHSAGTSSGQVAPANDLGGSTGSHASRPAAHTHAGSSHSRTVPRTGASTAPSTGSAPSTPPPSNTPSPSIPPSTPDTSSSTGAAP